jgi:small-conductance mechanosensitive channel
MLRYLAHLLGLPSSVAYAIALGALLLVTAFFGFALHRLFHRWARRLPGGWSDMTVEMLESLVLPLLLTGALDVALELLELPSRYDRFAGHIIFAVVLGVVFNFLARVVTLVFRNMARRDPGFLRITQPATLFVRTIFGFLALIIFLENIGVSLTAVWTTLGVGSVAIGLALQATLSNFFAGLNILADRAISPGDHIKLSTGVEGDVLRIGWRATVLRTAEDEITFVPNSTMASANLTNYSLPELRSAVSVSVKVSASSDIDAVERKLMEIGQSVLQQFDGTAPGQKPQVSLTSDPSDPVLQFSLRFHVARFSERCAAEDALRKEIWKRYRSGELKGPGAS